MSGCLSLPWDKTARFRCASCDRTAYYDRWEHSHVNGEPYCGFCNQNIYQIPVAMYESGRPVAMPGQHPSPAVLAQKSDGVDLIRVDVRYTQSFPLLSVIVKSSEGVTAADEIALDEAIGLLARLFFSPGVNAVPRPMFEQDPPRTTPDLTIILEPVGSFSAYWNIRQGIEFSGQLTKDEAFASVTSFLFTKRWLFGGLKSYVRYVADAIWLRDHPPCALLAGPVNQPHPALLLESR